MDEKDLKDLLNRRDFLMGASALGAMSLLAAQELSAQQAKPTKPAAKPAAKPEAAAAKPAVADDDEPPGPPVKVGVIGLGQRGRDVVASLGALKSASLVAVCDSYQPFVNRVKTTAPKAVPQTDYRKLLDDKAVEAVVIATPSHQHKQIVLDAVQAGKHVYLEAPIASQVDEAKAIALAGKGSKQIFQVGLQNRSTPIAKHIFKFLRASVLGTPASARVQWHKKTSWRASAPSPEREKVMNWRLAKATSSGIMGEIGIHQIDLVNWLLKLQPISVSGFGATMVWKDGREVPDTVQAIYEYPGGFRLLCDYTLANSFSGSQEVLMGTDCAVLKKESKAWLVKEADSSLLGWEVYARKDKILDDVGIALVADATKQLKLGLEPSKALADETPPLNYALKDFNTCIRTNKPPVSGALEGYQSAVAAIRGHDAVMSGNKVTFSKGDFDLA
ncbi:MAG TPA: Gfo/Idh/MocA family oxidoreductase [Armatimonadota bacterium]|jgi:predicted dehydrogenase